MFKSRNDLINKIHLIISILIVLPVALFYGFYPDFNFDLHPETIDELNFFKAIMGIYIGFVILWILGIIHPKYLQVALISNLIFMLGLGFGRVLSLFLDGAPSFAYLFGTFAELFLGFYGVWVLRRKHGSTNTKAYNNIQN